MTSAYLNPDEKVLYSLRDLYRSYGYLPYKVSKFEEYDLYAGNKNFLVSDHVITFTDTDGKLMALKPDVTLSIIKNAHPKQAETERLFYDENVYRVSSGTRMFKEIKQAGLECLGDIDVFCISEVLELASKSLALISPSYVLEVSHAGIISEVLDECGFSETTKNEILRCMGQKNLHGVCEIFEAAGISPAKITALMKMNGTAEESLALLMLSQAEHDKLASAVLVTDSAALAGKVAEELEKQLPALPRRDIARASIDANGKIILVQDLDTAIAVANAIAPEHLELCVDAPFDYLDQIRHAGSVFLGRNCPEALGDYLAGPNHTLPTSGTARFSSPLSVDDFVKKTQYTYFTAAALGRVAESVAYFAEKEGLTAHARSALIRSETAEGNGEK